MAGSYNHCCKDDGTFIGYDEDDDDAFTDMIENLGDAYEACEEMHWMINYLAGGEKEKIKQASEAFYAYARRREHGLEP